MVFYLLITRLDFFYASSKDLFKKKYTTKVRVLSKIMLNVINFLFANNWHKIGILVLSLYRCFYFIFLFFFGISVPCSAS